MSDAMASELPQGRVFSKIEAMYSLQLDYDRGNGVTVAGMAARWGWSRNKVNKFLKDIGVVILYPESTFKKQNQKGQISIKIQGRPGAEKRQIRIIDNKGSARSRDRKGTEKGLRKGRSQATTKQNINPNSKERVEQPCKRRSGSQEKGANSKAFFSLRNPGFSMHFMTEVWPFFQQNKATPYKNLKSQELALFELFEMAKGDEEEATDALRKTLANNYQGYTWYFDRKREQQHGVQNGRLGNQKPLDQAGAAEVAASIANDPRVKR